MGTSAAKSLTNAPALADDCPRCAEARRRRRNGWAASSNGCAHSGSAVQTEIAPISSDAGNRATIYAWGDASRLAALRVHLGLCHFCLTAWGAGARRVHSPGSLSLMFVMMGHATHISCLGPSECPAAAHSEHSVHNLSPKLPCSFRSPEMYSHRGVNWTMMHKAQWLNYSTPSRGFRI